MLQLMDTIMIVATKKFAVPGKKNIAKMILAEKLLRDNPAKQQEMLIHGAEIIVTPIVKKEDLSSELPLLETLGQVLMRHTVLVLNKNDKIY